MTYQTFDRNEIISDELAFSKALKIPAKEFVPREVIAVVRNLVNECETEESVRIKIRRILDTKYPSLFSVIEKAVLNSPLYSAMFRGDELHVFQGNRILKRYGDIIIPKKDIHEFMSTVIHEDWEIDYNSWVSEHAHYDNLTDSKDLGNMAFSFDFKSLHYLRKDFIISED